MKVQEFSLLIQFENAFVSQTIKSSLSTITVDN